MHVQRLTIFLFSLLGAGTAFLPWKKETLLGETTVTDGTNTSLLLGSTQVGDGWLVIGIFGLILLIAMAGKRRMGLNPAKKIFIMLLAAGIAVLVIYDTVQLKKLSVSLPGSSLNTEVSAGMGLYAAGAVALLVIIRALVGKREPQPG